MKRNDCNVTFPGDGKRTAAAQTKAFRKFQLHLGRCLEAPGLLYSVGLIDEVAYNHFYDRAIKTMFATRVG